MPSDRKWTRENVEWKEEAGDACVLQRLCCAHPSLSPSLSLTSLPSNSRLSPMWTSTIMKKDVLCVRARAFVCLLGCACTRMCVTCVVMNKDVLCVELVVNHWQCWQLTDKLIDPRPPREHWLAPAHSSHTRTHTHTKTCVYAHARAYTARGPARVFELRIISDHSC